MSDLEKWLEDGEKFGWEMPRAVWWKRLPVIRHVRAAYLSARVEFHNDFWLSAGLIPTGYDNWVLWGIAH